MLFSDLYASVAARFVNWLEVSNTGNAGITNLALDYLNRAQDSLSNECPNGWVYLTKEAVALTLGGTDGLTVTFPTDMGRLLAVYTDNTGTGKPSIYFYKDGRLQAGFAFRPEFAKATGFVLKGKFFYTPPGGTVYCRYQIILPDFVGSGTEYCAFPGDLLLLEAQKIRCRDKGMVNEWKLLKTDYEDELNKFKAKYQNQAEEISIEINDASGVPISIPEYTTQSGNRNRQIFGQRNDRDGYRY